jgi:hypothetical protein
MARQETVLQVFLASPADTRPERDALTGIVQELNDTWSQSNGVRLEVVSWETRVHPGIGPDSQAVINSQIGESYDVFVGVMWSRVGTPTSRAESGTIEEFDRALVRYRNGDRVQILMYFKNAPIAPDEIDVEQLAGVHRFRQRLNDEGVLYSSFTNVDDFEGLLRLHLSLLLQSWRSHPNAAPVVAAPLIQNGAEPSAGDLVVRNAPGEHLTYSEEPGFIDLVEAATEHMEELTANAGRIAEATQLVGRQVETRAKALTDLAQSGNPADLRAVKRVTNLAAQDLEHYAKQLRLEIPLFSQHYQSAIEAFGAAIGIAPEIDSSAEARQRIKEAMQTMIFLKTRLGESRHSMHGFREVTASLPRMTTAFNRARRMTVDVLDAFLGTMDAAIAQTAEAEDAVRRLLDIQDLGGRSGVSAGQRSAEADGGTYTTLGDTPT